MTSTWIFYINNFIFYIAKLGPFLQEALQCCNKMIYFQAIEKNVREM